MNVGATKKIRPDQLTGTLAESLLEWTTQPTHATKRRDNI